MRPWILKYCLDNWGPSQTTSKNLRVTIPSAHCSPFPRQHTTATYLFPACVDFILAPVSSLARATYKKKRKKKKEESHLKSLQIDDGDVFLPRSWRGLEPTQAVLVYCKWMLRAGGNCSHLPAPDVSADRGRLTSLLWCCYAALSRSPFNSSLFPQRGCCLLIVTHS